MPLPRPVLHRPLRRLARTAPTPLPAPGTPALAPRGHRLAIGAGLVLFGLIFAGIGWHVRSTSRAAAKWPTAEGVVEASGVVQKEERDHGPDARRGTHTMYAPAVSYRYTVEGKSFRSGKIGPVDSWSSSESDAWTTSSRYKVNAPVTVHYNPDRPAEAFLETDATGSAWIFIAAGLVILALGSVILRGAVSPGP